jgi:hypothetical protein
MTIKDEAVEAAAKAFAAISDPLGVWEDQAQAYRNYYKGRVANVLEAVAPYLKAQALEEVAAELARLPYVRPDSPARDEYERILAVRRGDTDKWLQERAKSYRSPQVEWPDMPRTPDARQA